MSDNVLSFQEKAAQLKKQKNTPVGKRAKRFYETIAKRLKQRKFIKDFVPKAANKN